VQVYNSLTLDPTDTAFDYLAVGEQTTILVNYSVIDHAGGLVSQTGTITINGTNDIPMVSAAESSITTEGDVSYSLNLLLHASDPDSSDTLTVGSVTYTVDGIPTGNGGADLPAGVTQNGSTLTIDPDNGWFSHLAVGERSTIVASYIISDSSGRSVHQDATVTINGSDDFDGEPPTVISFSPADGEAGVSINENIVLSFSEPVVRGIGLIAIHADSSTGTVIESYNAETSTNLTVSGSMLTINPSASLVYGKHYYVTFADGSIDDYAGNHFAGSNSYGFTTGADPYAGSSDDNECTELFISGVGALGILAWLVF
jgi:methionine-rich copper-binding protein CopC